MTYHVLLTDRAQADVEKIVDWLVERSPQGTQHWLTALEAAMDSLQRDPCRFARAEARSPRRRASTAPFQDEPWPPLLAGVLRA